MARTTYGRTSAALSLAVAALLAAQFIPSASVPPPPEAKVQTPQKALAVKPAPQALRVIALPPPPAQRAQITSPAPQASKPRIEPLKVRADPPPPPPLPPVFKPLKAAPPEPVKATPPKAAKTKPPKTIKPAPKPVKIASAKVRVKKAIPVRASRPTPQATATGRVLLRVLEHGKGPAIEIAWPSGGNDRRRLADLMRRCYGMELALMDGQGRLFVDQGDRGEAWRPNLDLYSGFVRQISGGLQPDERQTANRIRRRHGQAGPPVRIYPRRVDSLLLGGLRQIIGPGYGSAASIRATYRIEGRNVIVGGIGVDGRGRAGAVNLTAAAHCSGA